MNAQNWLNWMNTVPPEGIPGLLEALKEKGHLPNGHHPVQLTAGAGVAAPAVDIEKTDVKVTRMPTEACYVTSPAYIDAMGLIPIYEKLAFKTNIMVKGPKGIGKSLSLAAFAAHKRLPVVTVECSEDTKKYDLMGSPYIIGDETVFVLGGIPTAIEIANEVGYCILNFEEVNSLTPQVQKMLNAVADFRQAVSLPYIGKVYRLAQGAQIWIFASMNPTVYGGTYDLNEDLKSRFEEVEVTYPKDVTEKAILAQVAAQVPEEVMKAFLTLAKETRSGAVGYPLSTRDLVRILNNVQLVGLDTTLQLLIGKFENEDKDVLLKRMAAIFTNVRLPAKFWGTV